MHTVKGLTSKTRVLLCLRREFISIDSNSIFTLPSVHPRSLSYNPVFSTATSIGIAPEPNHVQDKDGFLSSFRNWFKSRNNPLLDQIFEIVEADDPSIDTRLSADSALCNLNLPLSEQFVLEVLNYGREKKVLSCLKFFDWAGRQPGFNHTRSTYFAIFKILARPKLMPVMLEFLDKLKNQRYHHKSRFYSTLVIGYAIAGKPGVALRLFGRMRFQGIDLDKFSYHVLLNSLVEEEWFDAVDFISKQIFLMGLESHVTHTIIVKNLCKQRKLDEAEAYLRELAKSGKLLSGHTLKVVVNSLCKCQQFEKAGMLVEEFRQSGVISDRLEPVYSVWISDLVQAGKVDGALDFLKQKKLQEGYIPEVFRYNMLIYKLLIENRIDEVLFLLEDMKENNLSPDEATMNAVICFFCKYGLTDIALQLYKSREEFDLSPNSLAYNYLINTLCGDGSTDEAYRVLKDLFSQGCFPWKRTIDILANSLCRERKFGKMMELVTVALDRSFTPSDAVFNNFICSLCQSNRVEDAYLFYETIAKSKKINTQTFRRMIYKFNQLRKGDMAAELLIEMQEKGFVPPRNLFRAVIIHLCAMGNTEKRFKDLLNSQLSRFEASLEVLNCFIDGAGHVGCPYIAREVYDIIVRFDILPDLTSDILMLQGYLKNNKISDALHFFNELSTRRRIGRKLSNTMIVGLCKAEKADVALEKFWDLKSTKNIIPSLECYEELVKLLCARRKYDEVVNIFNNFMRVGKHMSSFMGNVLLFHSLQSRDLYLAWIRARDGLVEGPLSERVGRLIDAFSNHGMIENGVELEAEIRECFPLDTYTYNVMLERLSLYQMDEASKVFNLFREKGCEPNKWSFVILIEGFAKRNQMEEAKKMVEEMIKYGYEPTKEMVKYGYEPTQQQSYVFGY